MENEHEIWMGRALDLARRGEGLTRPNPPVGAVVVRDGMMVGEGWHRKAGGPHAEVIALEKAGERAKGATLYVTLEPCSTTGRTPPCTTLIRNSGVSNVIIAVRDPHPHHQGRGVRMLRAADIRVKVGVGRVDAAELIAPFTRWIQSGRPYVTLKLAVTLDGKIADRRGHSKWISGSRARRVVKVMRRRVDAIMVGGGTVVADNPSLWPKPTESRNPYRVILDREGQSSPSSKIYTDKQAAQTVVALGKEVAASHATRYIHHGARVLHIPKGRMAGIQSLLKQLAEMDILHVLCEGGGDLADSLIRAGAVDEYVFFVAPKIMGGDASISAVRGKGWLMSELPELYFTESCNIGEDIMIKARPL